MNDKKKLLRENFHGGIQIKKRLVDYLACPKCNNSLTLESISNYENDEIIDGTIKCECGLSFPIVSGVPKMLHHTCKDVKKSKYTFSKQWNLFDYNDKGDDTWLNLNEEARISRFTTAFNIEPNELVGKTILDAGCGNGRLSHSISKLGCEVIAMDISSGVEHASKHYKDVNLHYLQGDIMNIPLKEKSFDYIWSAGVLHHTPNTKKAFDKLVPLVKKGGILYVWVYGWPKDMINIRAILWWSGWKLILLCPDFIKTFFCYIYAPLRTLKEAILLGKDIDSRTIRQKMRAFYDNTSPHMYYHNPTEVKKWFKEHNLKNVKIPIKDYKTFCGFGTRGYKQ